MKKIFLFVCIFLAFASIASAQRIDVEVNNSGYKVVLLKAKVLKHSNDDTAKDMLDFYYEENEQAVYVSTHSNAKGQLFLQRKSKYTGETVAQCVDRLIKENKHLFQNLTVKKVYLMACYEEARHKDNPADLFVGHSDFFNVDIYEISRFYGQSSSTYYVKNGMIYSIEYDRLNSNPLTDKDKYKLVKDAAESANATWAVEMLKNNKQF